MNALQSKKTLAVALIVKNEEKHLRACLETVSGWVDEIVILDSGSTDATESIAREFTDKFYVNTDWPGFGKQRQLAQSYIQSDYVLWLDADERVTSELRESILSGISGSPFIGRVNRLSAFMGGWIRHSGWQPDWVDRLYPTRLARYNDAMVHEKVENFSALSVKKLNGLLHHYTYDSVRQYLDKSAMYAHLWADQRFLNGKKVSLLSALSHSAACFLKMYVMKQGFRDGRRGFLLAVLSANSTFSKYADLWVRNIRKNDEAKGSGNQE